MVAEGTLFPPERGDMFLFLEVSDLIELTFFTLIHDKQNPSCILMPQTIGLICAVFRCETEVHWQQFVLTVKVDVKTKICKL